MLVELSEGGAGGARQADAAAAYPAPLRHSRPGAQTPQQPVARPPARRTHLARQPHVQRWAGAAAAGAVLGPSASPRVLDLGAAATWRERQARCEESGGRRCGSAPRRFCGVCAAAAAREAPSRPCCTLACSSSALRLAPALQTQDAARHTAASLSGGSSSCWQVAYVRHSRGERQGWQRGEAWEQRETCHCRRRASTQKRSGRQGHGRSKRCEHIYRM
jgi:hypothetical protein